MSTTTNEATTGPSARRQPGVQVGDLVAGRYLVVRILGRKRCAETLLATDTASNDVVVVKALPSESVFGDVQARLEHEAAASARGRESFLGPRADLLAASNEACIWSGRLFRALALARGVASGAVGIGRLPDRCQLPAHRIKEAQAAECCTATFAPPT